MAASSFSTRACFLSYLTVFKSRLASVNIVLPLAGFAFQSPELLARRVRAKLSERTSVRLSDVDSAPIFQYLVDKHLIGSSSRESGRYRDVVLYQDGGTWKATDRKGNPLHALPVFNTDIWLADGRVRSTVGVPTPDNVDEVLQLCYQLRVLTEAKSTWTPSGHLATKLRESSAAIGLPVENPMLLGLDAILLLRQVLQEDGLMIREILARFGDPGTLFSRDDVAAHLYEIAASALKRAEGLNAPPPAIKDGRTFVRLVKETAGRRAKKEKAKATSEGPAAKGGPGVFEHRTAPRLEWLVDFGVLAKTNVPKNAFSYTVTEDAPILVRVFDQHVGKDWWPDDAALSYWREAGHWGAWRRQLPVVDAEQALLRGYSLMRRSIGPAPIREVCFGASVMFPALQSSMGTLTARLVEWAKSDGRITLSGGRFTRTPQLVHITPELLPE